MSVTIIIQATLAFLAFAALFVGIPILDAIAVIVMMGVAIWSICLGGYF